jgi:hypothetical protein
MQGAPGSLHLILLQYPWRPRFSCKGVDTAAFDWVQSRARPYARTDLPGRPFDTGNPATNSRTNTMAWVARAFAENLN